MKIDERQLDRFRDMMLDFARQHGISARFNSDSLKPDICSITFVEDHRYMTGPTYDVDFTKVRSLTEAAAPIMADILVRFNINKAGCSDDIKNVIFNPPATIVFWADGTKTVVKDQGEGFDPEKGLAMAISKKAFGNQGNYFNHFKKWTEKYEGPEYAGGVTVDEFIRNIRRVFGLPEKD